MPERIISVLIVDDHPQVRLSLAVAVEVCDDLELAGQAKNGQEAIALVEQLQPDVILMDLIMPVMGGISATRIIHQKLPRIPIIVLTSTVEVELIQEAQKAGAHSYMFKDITLDTFADTIRQAVE